MEFHKCDLCETILEREKFIIAVRRIQINSSKQKMSTEEYYRQMKNYNNNSNEVIMKEICPECQKIWELLLKKRASEIRTMHKEITNSYNMNTNEPGDKNAI